jgi:hypothetical protein
MRKKSIHHCIVKKIEGYSGKPNISQLLGSRYGDFSVYDEIT